MSTNGLICILDTKQLLCKIDSYRYCLTCCSLKSLDVSCNVLGDSGAMFLFGAPELGGLASNTCLTDLNLSENDLSQNVVPALCEFLHRSRSRLASVPPPSLLSSDAYI